MSFKIRCKDAFFCHDVFLLEAWVPDIMTGREGQHPELLSKERADSSELWLLVILVAAGQGGCTELKLEAFAQRWVGLDAA